MTIITTVTTMTMIPLTILTISSWLPLAVPDQEKLSPYECGFSPLESARLPFSLQFFLVAVFFLLFDLEIALLLPLPWALNVAPTTTMVLALTILLLLTIGLAHEWSQGALDWTK
uniref:NADH-ubiquinone oxidoreductase chain 3 n=1 Tax=Pseudocalotes microlepis TaxID=1963763 RepID=A0A384T9I1_9SAUR|nr:NADH dehydrogenase subunit 3 [Pseudocalotes microlepis]AQU64361.1 NADH dehydrogenase subunit 3 [Pseudocalotes microlepis]QGN67004.1 NADH dehydrogenase subunit 3 [Pseudocalotes microlepis]